MPALLFTGAGTLLGKCMVKDISERGAKLVYTNKEELPDQILLTIGRDRRYGRTMWRRGEEVGIQFVPSRA
jgi:hypothetical protein